MCEHDHAYHTLPADALTGAPVLYKFERTAPIDMDNSAAIEAKLNKSLEELIKEQASQNASRGTGRPVGKGGARGSANLKTGHRKPRNTDSNSMDVDSVPARPRGRVDTSVLKPKGGVGKASTKVGAVSPSAMCSESRHSRC